MEVVISHHVACYANAICCFPQVSDFDYRDLQLQHLDTLFLYITHNDDNGDVPDACKVVTHSAEA